MQINDGSGWKSLPALTEVAAMDGGSYAFAIPLDETLPGFRAARSLSNECGYAMFRANGQEGDGFPYWVSMSTTPELRPDGPLTVWLSLAPADLSETWTSLYVDGRCVYSGPALEAPKLTLRAGEVFGKSRSTRIPVGEPIPWAETHETHFHQRRSGAFATMGERFSAKGVDTR